MGLNGGGVGSLVLLSSIRCYTVTLNVIANEGTSSEVEADMEGG